MPEDFLPVTGEPAGWRETLNEWQNKELERSAHYVETLGQWNLENTSYGLVYRMMLLLDGYAHQLVNVQAGIKLQEYVTRRKAELGEPPIDPDDTQEIEIT